MSQAIAITSKDILNQVKLSCKIPSFAKDIVSRKLMARHAEELGIKVESDEVQKAADDIRSMRKLKRSEETWKWLQENSLSLDDFEEIAYTSALSTKLANHLFGGKVEQFFAENQLDYTLVIMYEVILEDQDLATELFYALQEGEISFPEMAHQYIQHTSLRRTGGYQGVLRRKDLKPEISAQVFSSKPPQILKPIVTSQGVHLIYVEQIIQMQLDEKLHYEILSHLFSSWLKQQIEEIEIVIQLDQDNQTT